MGISVDPSLLSDIQCPRKNNKQMRPAPGDAPSARVARAKELFCSASALIGLCKILDDVPALLKVAYIEFIVLKVLHGDFVAARARLAPTKLVADVWFDHILCPQEYASFCNELCGRIIEHEPITTDEPLLDQKKQQRAARERVTIGIAFGTAMYRQYWNIPARISKRYPVIVRTLTGSVLTLNVGEAWCVYDVKCELERRKGIPPTQQRLIYMAKELDDTQSLLELDLPLFAAFLVLLDSRRDCASRNTGAICQYG